MTACKYPNPAPRYLSLLTSRRKHQVLCDCCDALEGLFLAQCPAATQSTIEQMLSCCLHLKVRVVHLGRSACHAKSGRGG